VHFGKKYGYTPESGAAAPARIAQILRLLSSRLEQQRAKGSKFFIGDRLSALDIYWATFAALIQPLSQELCPMPPAFRTMYTNTDPVVQAAVTPLLLEHRDFIYHEYLELPIEL
jgi:glutathione S-transferase